MTLSFSSSAWRPLVGIYMPGIATFAVDLQMPLDIEIGSLYAVEIAMAGWVGSHRHLWFATALFILFAYLDLWFGHLSIFPDVPQWVFWARRSCVVCALVLLAIVVHAWIRSADLIKRYGRELEQRVKDRTRDLEIVSRQHEEAQAAFYQAQKMDAVGKLTGGVAHDFNNLLTIIGGNAAMLQEGAPTEMQPRRLEAIVRAVDRGARLTRQLLAFSRLQTLHPETLDLRERTREIVEMMARVLRGNVQVVIVIAEDVWPVEADPAELELAALNIGINARDAMPEGGVFRISAHNETLGPGGESADGLVGDFVAITFSDTGTGIEPHVLERVFEPFFTTKGAGKGSGLGLSQVYGFAKQSGGAVSILSMVGRGTAITLHLPRGRSPVGGPSAAPVVLRSRPAGGAVILYVEDDPAVAEITRDVLAQIGFEAQCVGDAQAALAALDRRSFDLVLTDVVMPGGMSGIQLAHEIRARRPGLPVLLTSGYSDELHDAAQKGFPVLPKPYDPAALAAALEKCLAARPARDPS